MAVPATKGADTIGPYRIIRQLGAGGMGEVFLAHDDDLGRDIAVKLLPEHLAESAEHLFRLRHEARSASSLNHPNIVTIYEIGRDDDGRAFVAMEYIDGQTLRELMLPGPMPVRKALQLVSQIADGLAAAHKRGLVHRDLKPENIMITADGVVKILDFGLAKTLEAGAMATTPSQFSDPGMIVGTYMYMSPEQARAGEVDYRSDQFALGAILYEMLTGKVAFQGATAVETLFMVVRDDPAPLSVVAPHVPAPVRWIVDRALAKDPDDRYVATRDLARDLQYIRDHFSETGIVTPVREEKPTLAGRARQLLPVAVLLLLALAVGAASAWVVEKPAPRTITSERYLTYSGQDFSPAVSPDGKLIAFSSNRDGVQRIWLKQVSGGSEVALTEGPDDFPRFSPDGSTILYARAEPGKPAALYRVATVGGEARRIIEDATTGEWSPDGRELAFTRNLLPPSGGSAATALYVSSPDGTNVRQLARLDASGLLFPRWSPDGSRIAVVGARGRVVQAVYVFDVKNGGYKLLSSPDKAGEVSSVVWTRDGKHVIYSRADSVEAVVGSTAHIIKHDVARDTEEVIAWSSHNGTILDVLVDGTILLDTRSPRDNLRALPLGGDASADRWITRGNSSDRQPVYAPDGKSMLFTSNRSGNLDLWLIATDGTVKRVTDDAAEDWDPAFTTDGKRILWSSGRSGKLEIWIANADGSDAKQISQDGYDAENPSSTADGWVIYNSFHPQKEGVWKVREDGTRATRIVAGRTSLPEVSPDGQYVAYLADGRTVNQALRVARVSDGKDMGFHLKVLATRRTGAILGRMRWMPGSNAIAYLGQDKEGVNGVFVQDFVPFVDTEKTRRPLGGFDRERATESFGLSPDGKTLTVAGWEQLFSIFSIEGIPEVTAKRVRKES